MPIALYQFQKRLRCWQTCKDFILVSEFVEFAVIVAFDGKMELDFPRFPVFFLATRCLTFLLSMKIAFADFNPIASIPSNIGTMTRLTELSFCEYIIWWMMDIFGDKTMLILLLARISPLDDNDLTSIPSEIGLLTNLENLWFGTFRSLCSRIVVWILWNSNGFSPDWCFDYSILCCCASTGGNNMTRDDLPEEVNELCASSYCWWLFWGSFETGLTIVPIIPQFANA